MNQAAAIEISRLSKRYGNADKLALNKLDLTVRMGEIYGFLGPNGSGKSTTIRLLLNFIEPTAGGASILGHDIIKESVKIRGSVGYLAGDISLYPKMTGRQFLDYMNELQPPKRKGYVDELASRFDVSLSMKIRELSKGNRQKIGIIQAFASEPDILILDEPTIGLDPLKQEQFFSLIRETKARGASVFFSSHNLAEVQRICDRVGFIRKGKLIAEQTIADAAAAAARTFDVTFANKAPRTELKKIPAAKVEFASERTSTIHMRGELSPMFKVLARHKVVSINQREVSLEDEFLRFYKGEKE